MWGVLDGTSNSGGNLALHLVGNLNTYFGKNLGNTGYVRNRMAEFADKNIPKDSNRRFRCFLIKLMNYFKATLKVFLVGGKHCVSSQVMYSTVTPTFVFTFPFTFTVCTKSTFSP